MKCHALIAYADGLLGVFSTRELALARAESYVAAGMYDRDYIYIWEAVLDE